MEDDQDLDTFMTVLRGLADTFEEEAKKAIVAGEMDAMQDEADWLDAFNSMIDSQYEADDEDD